MKFDFKAISLFLFVILVAMTAQPTNEAELQLYRVLQRANLLTYYDTFISCGKVTHIYTVTVSKLVKN